MTYKDVYIAILSLIAGIFSYTYLNQFLQSGFITEFVQFNEQSQHPPFNPKWLLKSWQLSELNEQTYENMADVDAVLNLPVPGSDASDDEFYVFEYELKNIKLGKRYSNYGTNTPLLAWYVYIAKYSPQTIYRLYNEKDLDDSKFAHLASFGYLPDWYESIDSPDNLILDSHKALLSLVHLKGEDYAKRVFLDTLFSGSEVRKITLTNLLFSADKMTNKQKLRLKNMFLSGEREIDPRSVVSLYLTGKFNISEEDALEIIQINAFNEKNGRIASSYFVDAAGFGDIFYFIKLLEDTPHNDEQPSKSYCAACGVALYGEGPIGKPLIDMIIDDKVSLDVVKRNKTFFIEKQQSKNYLMQEGR